MTLFADTNILVDSFKLDIYKDFLALEDDIYMESSMLEDEVLNPPTYADELRTCGLKTTDMTDEEFVLAVETRELHHKLSFYDCVAYAVAKTRGWSLVTGDNRLRKLAEKNGVEVHGIIWVIQKCGFDDDRMKSIFDTIHSDSTILVPEDLLQAAFPVFDDKKNRMASAVFGRGLFIRISQAVGPEARHSHRNSKRCTPSHHVPERILPYMLCLQYF